MISQLSSCISKLLVQQNVIQETEKEIYQYGSEILLSTFLTIIITFLVGHVLSMIWEALIFLLVFAWIRRNTGGFHASTYFRCNVIYAIVLVCTLWISKILVPIYALWMHALVLILYLITVLCFSPVENNNKPIPMEKRAECRSKSVVYGCLLSIGNVVIQFLMHDSTFMVVTDMTLITIILSIGISLVLKGGECYEKKDVRSSCKSD